MFTKKNIFKFLLLVAGIIIPGGLTVIAIYKAIEHKRPKRLLVAKEG